MKRIFYFLFISSILLNCDNKKKESYAETAPVIHRNMSGDILSQLEWFNEPVSFELVDSSLQVTVAKGSDFFNNPEDSSTVSSAPYLHQSMMGDFVVKALVQPDFTAQWNAVALMVHLDSMNWIKFAFENSDATGPSIVTVVTRGMSDDANGVILNEETQIWIALAKKNNIYSMHWSKDGKSYKMARLTSMPEVNEVSIGIEFQSPVGNKATHTIHFFEAEERTIKNIRTLE